MVNKLMVIDAGNSAIKWSLADESALSEITAVPYEKKSTVEFFIEHWKSLDKPIKVVASCVASDEIWKSIVAACNKLWELDIERVFSVAHGNGLNNAYATPSDLGSDRWCAMIGTQEVKQSPFMVVDSGSALTIDVVNENGQHLGGYITPGLNMMRRSLGMQTAQLNADAAEDITPSLSLGDSTDKCIESGILLSAVKLIEAVYDKESNKIKNLKCYLTGGDAKTIAAKLSFDCHLVPDLVLRGLVEIEKNT